MKTSADIPAPVRTTISTRMMMKAARAAVKAGARSPNQHVHDRYWYEEDLSIEQLKARVLIINADARASKR